MLLVERRHDVIVWTVDRPEAKNALDHATLTAFIEATREAAADRSLRAGIVTGAGGTFVSGGDLRELRDRNTPDDAERLSDAGFELTSNLSSLPFPVIAAVSGPAIGGGAELAVACDVRIADARARLCFKQVRMGVSTAWGTVPRLVALVGAGTTARLLYSARDVTADEAQRLGLVDEVTEDGQALAAAHALAAEIALGSPSAISATKQLVREASMDTAPNVRALERSLFVETWTSADHREAVSAYFERRAPLWQDR